MSESEWLKFIEDCLKSGISPKLWCEKHGVKLNRYRYWAKKLQPQSQQWAQISAYNEEKKSNEIKLHCGKWVISVEDDFSPKLLADVLKVVDAVCC